MVSDAGRLGRAALSVDGRGLQHVRRLRRRRGVLQGHDVRRYGSARAAQRVCGHGDPGQRTADDHQAGRGAAAVLDGLPEAGADAVDPAGRGRGPRRVRSRVSRVRAPLEGQASPTRGFLPNDERSDGT